MRRLGRKLRLGITELPRHCALAVLLVTIYGALFTVPQARADDAKRDPWCKVIEGQLKRNDDEARKGQNSQQSERLREERRRIKDDYHNRHCDGH